MAKTSKEEFDEMASELELVDAEIVMLNEELGINYERGRRVSTPPGYLESPRGKFVVLRRAKLFRLRSELLERLRAKQEYDDWERRTQQNSQPLLRQFADFAPGAGGKSKR